MNKGFTLIELIVVIAIIAVLSGVILFSITQYISKGKDSNVSGNLAVLVPAGEVFYNGNGNSYRGFCTSNVANNAFSQMPPSTVHNCAEDSTNNSYQAWAACAREFTNSSLAFCVDSRGVKKEIDNNSCKSSLTQCP
jgi:prepilin-type N-terminal cleavage/methylation domain-containing protein